LARDADFRFEGTKRRTKKINRLEMVMDIVEHVKKILPKIHGWCSVEKAEKFIEIITQEKPEICVEIGVFGGSSLVPQALALKENDLGIIFAIDPWATDAALEEMIADEHKKWWSKVDLQNIYTHFLGVIQQEGLTNCVKVIRDKAENVVDQFKNESIDLLHIDGNHSEALSYKDATLYLPKVRKGGVIFFDDIHWAENNQVTTRKALNYLFENCEKIDLVNNDCLVFRKS
jgi:predicted O-methyltransferase YrrM